MSATLNANFPSQPCSVRSSNATRRGSGKRLKKWQADDGPTWAASLGYYAAFSFFPLVLVLLYGAGLVLRYSPAAHQFGQDQLIRLVGQHFSRELADQLPSLLTGVETNASDRRADRAGRSSLCCAIGIFAYCSTPLSIGFGKVQVDPQRKTGWLSMIRNVLFVRLRAFLMLVALGGLVLLAFFLGLVVSGIAHEAAELPFGLSRTLFHFMHVAVGWGLNALFFTLVYRLLPRRHVGWGRAAGGGLVAALFWEAGRQLLAMFLVGAGYTAYGVVGRFIIMMLWFNYASMVLLFGAEFVEIGSRANTKLSGTVA